jgi:hypothetical protein
MATLNLWNYFSLDSQGGENTGKQGSIADAPQTPFPVTVTGTGLFLTGSFATATPRTIYDDSGDFPASFDFTHYWCDVNSYIQFVFGASNVILPVLAKVPFCLAPLAANLCGIAAANTTIMTGTEPTLTDLDKVVIAQWSGGTANYRFEMVD